MKKVMFSTPVRALMILLVFCTTVLIYTSNITHASFDIDFYEDHYDKHDIRQQFNSSVELTEETTTLIAYLENGVQIEEGFFNEKEIAHLVDVRKIFQGIQIISNIAVILSAIVIVALFFVIKPDYARHSGKAADDYLKGIIAKLLIWTGAAVDSVALLFGIIALTFSSSFIWFHKIFFSNNLWMLDPATDNLVRMLPEVFFFDIFVRIILLSVLFATLLLVAGFLIHLRKPRWMKK